MFDNNLPIDSHKIIGLSQQNKKDWGIKCFFYYLHRVQIRTFL